MSGASVATLRRRVRYGGRKGRSALRRLGWGWRVDRVEYTFTSGYNWGSLAPSAVIMRRVLR